MSSLTLSSCKYSKMGHDMTSSIVEVGLYNIPTRRKGTRRGNCWQVGLVEQKISFQMI